MLRTTHDRQDVNRHIEATDPSFDDFRLDQLPAYPPRNLCNVTQIGPRLWIALSLEEGCKVILVADNRAQAVFKPERWDDACDDHLDAEAQQRWFKDLCKRQGRQPSHGAVLESAWSVGHFTVKRHGSASGHWSLVVNHVGFERGTAPDVEDEVIPVDATETYLRDALLLEEPTPLNAWCRRAPGAAMVGQRCAA